MNSEAIAYLRAIHSVTPPSVFSVILSAKNSVDVYRRVIKFAFSM